MAHPLNNLLKKDKKFVWSKECQDSFDLLKKQFTEEPVLMMPDHTRPFQIQVNSLLFATGGILTQMDTNKDCHPCTYLSKSLTKEQRNYKLVHIPENKNIQADALSRRPDLCPEGTDNENIIVSPEHLFANLIDTELQRRIANTKDLDYNTAEVIKGLLGQGPNEAKKVLEDWEVEEFKGKNYIPNNGEL